MKVIFNPKKFWQNQYVFIGLALISICLFILFPPENWPHQDTSFRREKLFFLTLLIPIIVCINIIWRYFTNRLKAIETSGKGVKLIFKNRKMELNLLTEILLSKENICGHREVTLKSNSNFYTIPAYYEMGNNESVESFVVKYSEEQKIPIRNIN